MADTAVTTELALLAQLLEQRAGITPDIPLRRDTATNVRIKRIREALTPVLDGLIPSTSLRFISFSIQDPENAKTHAGRSTKSFLAWLNDTGLSFTISKIAASADELNYTFSLFKSAAFDDISTTNDTLLKTVIVSTPGTAGFFASITAGFDSNVIETGKWLIWEHTSGTAESLSVVLEGTFA